MSSGKVKRLIIGMMLVFVLICVTGGGMAVLSKVVYNPDAAAAACLEPTADISVRNTDKYIAFVPNEPEAGFVFYPNLLVSSEAYAPLMRELADRNVLAVVAKTPLGMSFLNKNAADDIRDSFLQISDWYVGGHSVGGKYAADYAALHTSDIRGLILLACAYGEDISGSGLKCLSIYGTNDSILSEKKYNEKLVNLPDDARLITLEGGNHSQFGNYSGQIGDERASISADEQLDITVDEIVAMMNGIPSPYTFGTRTQEETTVTAPATTVPETTVPATTVPATTVPATTVPATTVPAA